jgi:hypothetical protein
MRAASVLFGDRAKGCGHLAAFPVSQTLVVQVAERENV